MSPTIHRENGYRYFFFSKEEDRIHVHIVSGDGEAKFWLEPEVSLAKNYHYSAKQLSGIEAVIQEHYDEFVSEWKKHFSS